MHQHHGQACQISDTNSYSKYSEIMNSHGQHGINTMSEFLAADTSTHQAPPLYHLLSNVRSDLGRGFYIHTADITLEMHKELADMSRTFTPFP